MERVSKNLAETEVIAWDFLTHLTVKVETNQRATVVGLHGDLGAGKTTFVQAIGRALGIKDRITSPTFVLIKNYAIPQIGKASPRQWKKLVHIDCYRLEKLEELGKLSWSELIADQSNLILIEWPERVEKILPAETIKINFEILGETERKIVYN